MNYFKPWKTQFQRIAKFSLGLFLTIGIVLTYSNVVQAAVDTTSAASKADANQIKQRKADASHYPNWYEDQRSLESYMDRAGVDPNQKGNSPTDQNDDQGYNPIRQDRVNGYNSDYNRNEEQNVSLIDRSRNQLKDAADNVRDTLNPNSGAKAYDSSKADANDIKDRTGNRLDRAKNVFQDATEQVADQDTPIITGESNR